MILSHVYPIFIASVPIAVIPCHIITIAINGSSITVTKLIVNIILILLYLGECFFSHLNGRPYADNIK